MKKITRTVVEEYNNDGKMVKITETTIEEENKLTAPANPYYPGGIYIYSAPATCGSSDVFQGPYRKART